MSLAARRLAGLGLIVAIVLAVVLGITKPNPFVAKHTYWAVFDTAHGLGAIDRDIRIAGVRVGEVGQVERTGDNVRVQLNLEQDYPLHTDARADMRPHTLFEGSNFIDLAPGSPEAPRLSEGGTIPLAQTTNYVTLDRALRVLRPEIRNNLRQLARVGSRTLQGEAITGVQETLKRAPEMTRALGPAARAAQGPHRRELVRAIRGAARTVDGLALQREDLIPLLRRLNRTSAALDVDGGVPLDAALAQLPPTLAELNQSAPALEATVRRLSGLASRIGVSSPESLARALRATTPLLTEATPAMRDGTPVVRGARQIAARLAAARGGLVEMFRVLAQPLRTFPETLATLNARSSLGASSGALQLVAGAFSGGDATVSGFQTRAQNPAQPGHVLLSNIAVDPQAVVSLIPLLGGRGAAAPRSGSTAAVPCSVVAQVSPRAVASVRANGGCR